MAWRLRTKLASFSDTYQSIIGLASTQYVTGQLAGYTVAPGTSGAGILAQIATQTAQPTVMIDSMDPQPYNGQSSYNVNGKNASPLRPGTPLLTTTAGERLLCVPITPLQLFDCDVIPCYNRVAAVANTTVANAVISSTDNNATPVTYTSGQLTGSTCYLPDQDWQAFITGSAVSAGNVTLVLQPPPPRACTTGDVVSVIPFGPGAAPKWDPVNFSLSVSNVFADATGGVTFVREINMQYGSPKGSLAQVTVSIKAPIQ